jgi:serine/threonine-protein kinase HipA
MLRQHRTLSGVQQKVSVGLDARSFTLRVGLEGVAFVLKPPSGALPSLPENELVTMRLAEAAGISVPPCALVRLRNGALAYITRRFDRTAAGAKVRQEDFCQLSLRRAKQKYSGSAEQCFKVVQAFATNPGVDALDLYRQFAFAWWVGNGDLHFKNLSMVMDDAGVRLSPAYDLVSTTLVIPDDQLALPIGGKRDKVTPKGWDRLAAAAGLPPRAAARALRDVVGAHAKGVQVIERSPLPEDMKARFVRQLAERARPLEAAIEKLG